MKAAGRPPTATVPVESILALHSCGNKPVYHQRVTHANERLFVFHCAHAGVREFKGEIIDDMQTTARVAQQH